MHHQQMLDFLILLCELYACADICCAGVLKKQKEEHEQFKKDNINTDKVELQKHEAVERYPQ